VVEKTTPPKSQLFEKDREKGEPNKGVSGRSAPRVRDCTEKTKYNAPKGGDMGKRGKKQGFGIRGGKTWTLNGQGRKKIQERVKKKEVDCKTVERSGGHAAGKGWNTQKKRQKGEKRFFIRKNKQSQ